MDDSIHLIEDGEKKDGKINADEYNKLDKEIRSKCQLAKELMLSEQCERLE